MNNSACEDPLANALTSNVLNVYAASGDEGSVKVAICDPSIVTTSVSVNGVVTVPIFNWKLNVAVTPDGIVTFCPSVAVSGAGDPPNHAQLLPANGPAKPPPVPHPPTLQSGVPKFVEVCTVHKDHGVPASNVPSPTLSDGVQDGLAVAVAVAVAVFVGVNVAVAVGVNVLVDVGVAVFVLVGVKVFVDTGVGVNVAVAVAVTVFVGVEVFVLVGVNVAVFVGVEVLVLVGVNVAVAVAVAVLVGVMLDVMVMFAADIPKGATKLNSRTRIRAVVVGVFGTVHERVPVLATFDAMVVGNVTPPSVDNSTMTFLLKPPPFVHVILTLLPINTALPLGSTLVIVSGVKSVFVSRYQPISRICWRVRSRSMGSPVLIAGSISRFGAQAVS